MNGPDEPTAEFFNELARVLRCSMTVYQKEVLTEMFTAVLNPQTWTRGRSERALAEN